MDKFEKRRQRFLQLINELCDGKNSEMGKRIGIADSYVSRLLYPEGKEWKKNIGEETVDKIIDAFKLPRGWLDDDSPLPGTTVFEAHQPRAPYDVNVSIADIDLRPIPVISAVQAGAMTEITDPYPPGDGFAVEYTSERVSRWTFALEIEGNSMMPDFRPGDRVIIDPEISPNPGDFVVARNTKKQATFKKYKLRGIDSSGKEIFELVPLNDEYPTLRSDIDHLQIIGVMIEHRKKYRRPV